MSAVAGRVEETVWITLADGCRLAARIWFPATASPQPAILEYLPYRRRDRHRGDDAVLHPALAQAGYVAVRVDMRGSGDSDGFMHDEYTAQEWADAIEVIAWIARQDWCDGNVGMMGLSWSGFNALQVAALAPPALKAIVTACASDDRYRDDMHYMGGCLLGDNLQYGSTLFTWLATPPDPAVVGDRWHDMWRQRLESVEPPALRWMRNPVRNAYWRSGSVCETPHAIEAAVLAVGGWADGYSNAVMRLLENLRCPRKGLIGPWGHAFPHVATPGPGIDFLAYLVRWWDHWLRGRDTGIMDEPMLTAWMQESEEPRPSFTRRSGRWIAERIWPPEQAPLLRLSATMAGLREGEPSAMPLMGIVSSAPDTGTASGEWCPYGWGPDMPLDQAADDAAALSFDGLPQSAPLPIMGGVEVRLSLRVEDTDALVAVRLNDVSPDGVSRRITYGLRNLALTDDLAAENAPAASGALDIVLRLNDVAYEVPIGNRLRLSVATACWPLAVGSPARSRVELLSAEAIVPLRDETREKPRPPVFAEPVRPPYPQAREIVPPARGRIGIERRLDREETVVEVIRNLGAVELADVPLTLSALGSETYTMPWREPHRASSEARRLAGFEREGWRVRVETVSRLTFAGRDFRFEARIAAFEDDRLVFERDWTEIVARPGRLPDAPDAVGRQNTANTEMGV